MKNKKWPPKRDSPFEEAGMKLHHSALRTKYQRESTNKYENLRYPFLSKVNLWQSGTNKLHNGYGGGFQTAVSVRLHGSPKWVRLRIFSFVAKNNFCGMFTNNLKWSVVDERCAPRQ